MGEKALLKGNSTSVKKLSANDVEQMYHLFEKYYECISFDMFQNDLKKKNEVILLRESTTNKIVGFTTIKYVTLDVDGKKVDGMFSGDTIVAKKYWGQKVMHMTFAKILLREKLKRPFSGFYWFLISKGYKTYLLLANNFTEFYPRHNLETPAFPQAIMDGYANEFYPHAYKKDKGLLVFEQSMGQLKGDVAPINDDLMDSHPSIAFFQKKNPEWLKGDELICLGVINWSMFTNFATKMVFGTGRKATSDQKKLVPKHAQT